MLENIKKQLFELKDKDVQIIIDEGRSRKKVEMGKIINIYNRTFLIEINKIVNSFSFSDLINKTIIIKKL